MGMPRLRILARRIGSARNVPLLRMIAYRPLCWVSSAMVMKLGCSVGSPPEMRMKPYWCSLM